MQMLATFATMSMIGTLLLSLLPEGGMKRTASMAVGLLTLLCWAEGIADLLGWQGTTEAPDTALVPTSVTLENIADAAAASLNSCWEAGP